jgi:hypothetical protein
MRMTHFVCSLTTASERTRKAIDDLAFQLDTKQWTQAGIALGRIEQLGEHIADLCRIARDAIHEDEFVFRAAEKAENGDTP